MISMLIRVGGSVRPVSAVAAMIGVIVLMLAGCEKSGYYKHEPPSGQGSVVVDNHTGDDISVFVDGMQVADVSGGDYEIVDIRPGYYRVVLSADHNDRSYRDDVDVLENRLTILDVRPTSSGNLYDYDVLAKFD